MANDDEVKKPAIVPQDEAIARRPETSVVGIPFRKFGWMGRRDTALTRTNTEQIRAVRENIEERTNLRRTIEKAKNLDVILATDQREREGGLLKQELEVLRTENDLRDEEARGRAAYLEEQVKQKRLELELAEAEEKLRRLKNQPPPLSDEEKRQKAIRQKITDRLAEHYTVNEIRRQEEALRNEILRRANGVITPDVQRELDNLRDAAQSLTEEL